MYIDYCSPSGFAFDNYEEYDAFVDDRRLETYNAQPKAARFMELIRHWADHYRTNNIFVPMGCDFTYTNAK